MRRSPASMAAALAALAVLTGCASQPTATPTPSPAPSFLCTPEAGGEQYSCDQRAYDEMKAKDALYAEAEEVYRKLHSERLRLLKTGEGADPALLTLVTGPAEQLVREALSQGDRLTSGTIDVAWVQRLPGLSMSGSVIAIEACLDAHTAQLTSRGGRVTSSAPFTRERTYFTGPLGSLKAVSFQNKGAASCAK